MEFGTRVCLVCVPIAGYVLSHVATYQILVDEEECKALTCG